MMGIITLEDVIEKLIQDGMSYHSCQGSYTTNIPLACHIWSSCGFVHFVPALQENIEDESDTLERTCTLRSALTFAYRSYTVIHCLCHTLDF